MTVVRCPAHDNVFDTETDHKIPGKPSEVPDPSTGGVKKVLTHPINEKGIPCHPDCPIGKKERAAAKSQTVGAGVAGSRRIA